MELLGALSLAQFCRDCGGLDDLNAREPHSMARSHLGVHLLHSTVERGVAELLVHVVVPGSALVTEPDTVVLDFRGVLLENLQGWNNTVTYKVPINLALVKCKAYLIDGKHLSVAFLNLLQFPKEVPRHKQMH